MYRWVSYGKSSSPILSHVLVSLFLILVKDILLVPADVQSNVQIIYMGKRQHDDVDLITNAHHEMLARVLGSKEASKDSMIYSYKHGFSGFAAILTPSQVRMISGLPGVVQVIPNRLFKLQTTRSWDYLGLPLYPANLMHEAKMGNGVIIGLLDTAGNSGPTAQTVQNTEPWVVTVAASTIDRAFPTPIVLGNNQTFVGWAMYTGLLTGFINLVYPEVSDLLLPCYCESLSPNDTLMAGNAVLCFTLDATQSTMAHTETVVKKAGGLGLIVAKNPSNSLYSFSSNFPCVEVSYEIGTQILYYIRSTRYPQVSLNPSKTHIGRPVPTNVAYFSARGPNSVAPSILKPDVAAPGAKILAAVSPSAPKMRSAYGFLSGTSMATPHVSGIVALLKSLHSDWSPAAIKSAIVTTAWTTDPSGEPIFAEGEPTKLSDPFDFGGGIVNPHRAQDPGLVYDMGMTDYAYYLCAMGYNSTSIAQLMEKPTFCGSKKPSVLNLNLPSITIPSLKNSITLTRTVTNVGAVYSKYKALIKPPRGISIAVKPDNLIFTPIIKAISFTVTISTVHRVSTGFFFGSLTWTDGVHAVRSPISVRTEIAEC